MIKAHEDFKHKARLGSAELRQITYICRLVEYYDHHDRYQQIQVRKHKDENIITADTNYMNHCK